MAVDQATQQLSTLTGVLPTYVAADAASHKFRNTGKELLIVRNANGGSARTVTVAPVSTPRPGNSQFPDITVPTLNFNVPALGERVIGPFPTCYNDADGKVNMSFSSATDVAIAVLQINPV